MTDKELGEKSSRCVWTNSIEQINQQYWTHSQVVRSPLHSCISKSMRKKKKINVPSLTQGQETQCPPLLFNGLETTVDKPLDCIIKPTVPTLLICCIWTYVGQKILNLKVKVVFSTCKFTPPTPTFCMYLFNTDVTETLLLNVYSYEVDLITFRSRRMYFNTVWINNGRRSFL